MNRPARGRHDDRRDRRESPHQHRRKYYRLRTLCLCLSFGTQFVSSHLPGNPHFFANLYHRMIAVQDELLDLALKVAEEKVSCNLFIY